MKTLKEYINESLLDDDILNGFDDTIINYMLNDKDSPLMKSFNLSPKYHELNIINDSLFVFGKGVELNPPFTHISNILPNIKNIVYSSSVIIKNHNNVFKNEYLADKIIAHSVAINCNKVEDVDLLLLGINQKYIKTPKQNFFIGWGNSTCSFHYTDELKNSSIMFDDNSIYKRLIFHCKNIPVLKNVKTNANKIRLYSPTLFDRGIENDITDKWLVPFEYQYYTPGIFHADEDNMKSVNVKDFKKLKAIINNPKKYNTELNIKFKPSIKASDLIPWINDYKTIDEVTISDNNIAIRLCKNKIYECHKTQTNDGWWLGIEKRS